MRTQIGTVTITRARLYKLDPDIPDDTPFESWVIVEPGDYPVYENGITRYWRMTGQLDGANQRLGDGMFRLSNTPEAGDDDVVFYSQRFGPDEWKELLEGFAADPDPALVFTLTG
jgi:hypothetical protein